jgi:hypothetical protein
MLNSFAKLGAGTICIRILDIGGSGPERQVRRSRQKSNSS